jgi:xanthosine utilization system XapX-like protein
MSRVLRSRFAAVGAACVLGAGVLAVPGTAYAATGQTYSCQTVASASDPTINLLLGLLGIVVQNNTVLVGVTCSPGAAGPQVVCVTSASNNSFNGLVIIDPSQGACESA